MKVLINAISIKEGGSLLVLRRYVENFLKLRSDMHIHIVLNSAISRLRDFQSQNISTWNYPSAEKSQLIIRPWYEIALNNLARKVRADVLFSLTNYLPSRPSVPSLLLVQHAGHFNSIFMDLQKKEFPSLTSRMAWRFKNNWVKRSVSSATRVTVQTESLANAIRKDMDLPEEKLHVIPHGLGVCSLGNAKAYPSSGPRRMGFITKYGVQKNFGVLLGAAVLLKKEGTDIRLVLTLDQGEEKNRQLLRFASGLGLDDIIENQGDIPENKIQSLYDSLDFFVFPSLCESFGFPMIEAMSRGLPLLVADVPSNMEVGGSAAIPFSPSDSGELSAKITSLLENEKSYQVASALSIARAKYYSWDATAKNTLELLESLRI